MNDCLFCGIVEGKTGAAIVYRDDSVLAFQDINPKAPVHILIIPCRHIATVLELEQDDGPLLANIFRLANRLAEERGIAKTGFRLVVNCGEDAGQTVFHLHYHLLGGRRLRWPPG